MIVHYSFFSLRQVPLFTLQMFFQLLLLSLGTGKATYLLSQFMKPLHSGDPQLQAIFGL